jgi:hypothetical protein
MNTRTRENQSERDWCGGVTNPRSQCAQARRRTASSPPTGQEHRVTRGSKQNRPRNESPTKAPQWGVAPVRNQRRDCGSRGGGAEGGAARGGEVVVAFLRGEASLSVSSCMMRWHGRRERVQSFECLFLLAQPWPGSISFFARAPPRNVHLSFRKAGPRTNRKIKACI